MDPIQIKLRGIKNQAVDGTIREIDLIEDSLSWFCNWLPKMYDLSGMRLYEDSHWKVPDIWQLFMGDDGCRLRLIEANEQIQGFIVCQVNGHIGIDGRPAIYVPFLAAAPWNRAGTGSQREFKGVGRILLSIAALYGFKHLERFALELHSLSKAEDFYRKVGMKETGRVKDNLKEFRLEKSEALILVRPFLASVKR